MVAQVIRNRCRVFEDSWQVTGLGSTAPLVYVREPYEADWEFHGPLTSALRGYRR